MILRSLFPPSSPRADDEPLDAFAAFLQTQKDVRAPFLLLFQAEHARLSGELARALSPGAFGPLPERVVAAIGSHDAGWDESDRAQLDEAPRRRPRAFPTLTTEETLPSWRRSIAQAQAVGDLEGVLVSRHFGFVGATEPDRQEYLRNEAKVREAIEKKLDASEEELTRWTAALGFCDVLSLYLCSGCRRMATLPFAHPASEAAQIVDRVVLSWAGDRLCFSQPIFVCANTFRAHAFDCSGGSAAVVWTVG